MQRARIDHARSARAMLGREVRVAVEEEVVGVGMFQLVQERLVVAMREGDRLAAELEVSPGAMTMAAGILDGPFDQGAIHVAIAEDEVRSWREFLDDEIVIDVAAVENGRDAACFDDA